MSITSVEVNRLVLRYLQEAGLEVPAYALATDMGMDSLEAGAPLPLGRLVDLLQKGMLYNKVREYEGSFEELPRALADMTVMEGAVNGAQEVPRARQPDLGADLEFTKVLQLSQLFEQAELVHSTSQGAVLRSQGTKLMLSVPSAADNKCFNFEMDSSITALASTPDHILVGTQSGTIKVFSHTLAPLNTLNVHQWTVLNICPSSSGALVSSVDARGGLIVWDPTNMACSFSTDAQDPHLCWLSPSKMAFSNGKTISILDTGSGQETSLPPVHGANIMHLAALGARFVSVDASNELRLWSSAARYPTAALVLGSFPLTLQCLPNDHILVVGIDGCVRILGENLSPLKVATIPDGSGAAAAVANETHLSVLSTLGQVSLFALGDSLKSVGALSLQDGAVRDMALVKDSLADGPALIIAGSMSSGLVALT